MMTSPRPTEKPFESRNGFGTKNRSVLLGLGVALLLCAVGAGGQIRIEKVGTGVVRLSAPQTPYCVGNFTFSEDGRPWRTFHEEPANVGPRVAEVTIPTTGRAVFFDYWEYPVGPVAAVEEAPPEAFFEDPFAPLGPKP